VARPARQPGAPPPPRRARGGGRGGGGRARARGGEVVRGVGVRPATPHWSGTPPAAGAAAIGVAKGEEVGSCSLLLLLHGSRPDASRGRAAVESVGLGSDAARLREYRCYTGAQAGGVQPYTYAV